MLFGYVRAVLLWCIGISALTAFFAFGHVTLNLSSGPWELTNLIGYEAIGVGGLLLVVLVLSYVIARPSQSRKERLLSQLRQAGVQT